MSKTTATKTKLPIFLVIVLVVVVGIFYTNGNIPSFFKDEDDDVILVVTFSPSPRKRTVVITATADHHNFSPVQTKISPWTRTVSTAKIARIKLSASQVEAGELKCAITYPDGTLVDDDRVSTPGMAKCEMVTQ